MSTFNRTLFSSGRDEWSTPQDVFDRLDAEFHFVLDVAARRENAKCPTYFGPDHASLDHRDGLTARWSPGPAFCNPPYSRGLQKKFIAKAAGERPRGVLSVLLLPARTDTRAFHTHIYDATTWQPRPGVEIRLLAGRLKFNNAKTGAPFPSMAVIFRPAPVVARTSGDVVVPDLTSRRPTMTDADFADRVVIFRDGLTVPVDAYLLLLNLEGRGCHVRRDGEALVVGPSDQLTDEDRCAIRQWRWHLLTLLDRCTRTDLDAHLFRDDSLTATAADRRTA